MNPPPILIKAIGVGLNLSSFFRLRWAGKQVYRLFTTPFKQAVRPKEEQFLATARQLVTERAGGRIREYHWGEEGPLVYLSLGWGYNAGRWRHFVPALMDQGYQVIAYDPPGHGLAPNGRLNLPQNAQIIQELVEAYGRPEIFMGHSFGGACMVQCLSQMERKNHPKRMVVMASFSDAEPVFRSFQRGFGIREGLYWQFVRVLERETETSVSNFDLARKSAQLSHVSVLLVHDPQDRVTPVAHAQRYHAYWENSVLYLPLGAKHHLGTPRVTDAILQFAHQGIIPQTATIQERPLPAQHDLVRYFAGLETS
jgi:pimeloyl-ACP methyl ester carboxylesterase